MAMQLTVELIVSLVSSACVGAAVAYFGNRIANAELYGHIKRHCAEIDRAFAAIKEMDERQRAHDRQMVRLQTLIEEQRGNCG